MEFHSQSMLFAQALSTEADIVREMPEKDVQM